MELSGDWWCLCVSSLPLPSSSGNYRTYVVTLYESPNLVQVYTLYNKYPIKNAPNEGKASEFKGYTFMINLIATSLLMPGHNVSIIERSTVFIHSCSKCPCDARFLQVTTPQTSWL